MKIRKFTWVGVAVLVAAAATLLLSTGAGAGSNNHKFRWDIVSINFTTFAVSAGGTASAQAEDLSKITLTGTGTFRSNPGNPQDVTGGGTWETRSPANVVTGSGTYDVTGFVSFTVAPGALPSFLTDTIGIPADARAGLAFLQIAYSDGSEGVLAVSCEFVGTPGLFEGVTASKGFVDYWNHSGGAFTVFHILR